MAASVLISLFLVCFVGLAVSTAALPTPAPLDHGGLLTVVGGSTVSPDPPQGMNAVAHKGSERKSGTDGRKTTG